MIDFWHNTFKDLIQFVIWPHTFKVIQSFYNFFGCYWSFYHLKSLQNSTVHQIEASCLFVNYSKFHGFLWFSGVKMAQFLRYCTCLSVVNQVSFWFASHSIKPTIEKNSKFNSYIINPYNLSTFSRSLPSFSDSSFLSGSPRSTANFWLKLVMETPWRSFAIFRKMYTYVSG